ncbi:MAG: hypothetical protein AB7H90_13125 [Alphaproteobacteria bacterium]
MIMIRVAALLVAASVFAVSIPAAADGIPREKRPIVTKKIKKKKIVRKRIVIEKKVVVEQKEAAPPVVAAPPTLPPPVFVWVPGHWTWNSPMNMHVWVPGMYVRPPSPAEEQNLALWRIGKWIGIGRDD